MDVMNQASLNQIARMAYGSREHEAGGRGIMGVLVDSETGKPRIVKYDTHLFSWSTANANDANQLRMANNLRRELLKLAANANLSQEEIGNIREQLGLAREDGGTNGTTLLSRKIVAQVVTMIDRDIWQKAFAGVDTATYSTRNQKTSYQRTVTDNHGEQTAANRSFGDEHIVQALVQDVFFGDGVKPMPQIKAMFQAAGLDVSLLLPNYAIKFLDTIESCNAFAENDQGAADRMRVYAQVLNLCARRIGETDESKRQAIENDIRYIIDRVGEGIVDPLPFGLGERTSSFCPAQTARIERELSPQKDEMKKDMTMALEEFIGKYQGVIRDDLHRGMGLTINGWVINEVGAKYERSCQELVNDYKRAFTDPDGRFDETGFRLSFMWTHQGMGGIAIFPDPRLGMRLEDLTYSPTGTCHADVSDAALGVKRKWGFVVERKRPGDVSVRYTIRKENLVSAARKNITQCGNAPFERLRSYQRALSANNSFDQVDVVCGYRYGENGSAQLKEVQAKSTYKYDQTLTDEEVATVNGDRAKTVVTSLLGRDGLVDQEMTPIFTGTELYSQKYDFDKEDFKVWLAQNQDFVVQTIRDLALGKQDAYKAFADSPEQAQVRIVGLRSKETILRMIAWLYAKAKGESPEKLRRAEVEQIISIFATRVERVRQISDKFYTNDQLGLIWDRFRKAPIDKIRKLNQAAGEQEFSTPEGAEWLREELDKYLRI